MQKFWIHIAEFPLALHVLFLGLLLRFSLKLLQHQHQTNLCMAFLWFELSLTFKGKNTRYLLAVPEALHHLELQVFLVHPEKHFKL